MQPINDASCGWLHALPPRKIHAAKPGDSRCDWLIVGAGYTGLSAARRLGMLRPFDRIVVVDANLAAEGASSRNSGYLIESSLNDGHLSDQQFTNFLSKNRLLKAGAEAVRHLVNEYRIDCDWNECGKYHATASSLNVEKLNRFSQNLVHAGISHDFLWQPELQRRLGTSFYHAAVYTHAGVMLQPAKLARGMIQNLPANVSLLENLPIENWQKFNGKYEFQTANGRITAAQALICTNAFLPSLRIKSEYMMPLLLSASLTRKLTDLEFKSLGSPSEWGVLSAAAMGATVRLTNDRRLLIRNTCEASSALKFSSEQLQRRQQTHRQGLARRFPNLPEQIIQYTWSGVTAVSRNSANIFSQLDSGLFTAGCYNGGGIGLATLFGEQLAHKACGIETPEIKLIEQQPKPRALPPQPLARWGAKLRLWKDGFISSSER